MEQTSQREFFPRAPGRQWTRNFLNEFDIRISPALDARSFFKCPLPGPTFDSSVIPSSILEYRKDIREAKRDKTSRLPLLARRYFRYLSDASGLPCEYDPVRFEEQGQDQDRGSPAQFELTRFLLGEWFEFERISVKGEDESVVEGGLGASGCIFQQGIRMPLMMWFAPDASGEPPKQGKLQSDCVPCDLDLCLFDPSDEACLLLQISPRQSTISSLHSRLNTLESSLVAAAIADLYNINAGPDGAIISNPRVEQKVYPAMLLIGTAMVFYRIEVRYELVRSVASYGWERKWERPQRETVVWRYIPRKEGLSSDREVEEWERRYLMDGMKDMECRREALRGLAAFKELVKNIVEGADEVTEKFERAQSRKRKRKREDDGEGEDKEKGAKR